MKRFAPTLLFALSLSTLGLFFIGGNGDISALRELQKKVELSKLRNDTLSGYVLELKEHNFNLKNDSRVLEKAVRNELALAREGELVFVFDE